MAQLIDTTEMYLRTILELQEEGIVPLRARISERLSHSGPTVSQTVARMERDGLVAVTADKHLEFTPEGEQKAVRVMRKHRLAERLLHDVIGLEWHYVHEEACRWEHVMSDRVERQIVNMVQRPTKSPYGNTIPGLDELGVQLRGSFVMPVTSVADFFKNSSASVFVAEVDRFSEQLQTDTEILQRFLASEILPGKRVKFTKTGAAVIAATDAGEVKLSREAAARVFVVEPV